MFGKSKAERIVANVEKMRKNAQEMLMWRNIPLARECVELLREIDDAEETPMGKALACEAIIEQLPQYDVPRMVLSILRYEEELLQRSDETEAGRYPTAEEVAHEIQRLEDYIDVEHVSPSAFKEKYQRHLNADPIERTPEWEEMYYEVEQECDRRLKGIPRGMGFCFAYWSTLRQVLAERGIEWHSPGQLNPRVHFD
jgi:hypothetical protein